MPDRSFRIAILACDIGKRNRLLKALKFHSFESDVCYILMGNAVHSSNGCKPETISDFPKAGASGLFIWDCPEGKIIPYLQEGIKDGQIDAVVYYGLSDYEAWTEKDQYTLYKSPGVSFLMTKSFNSHSLPQPNWFSWSGARIMHSGDQAPHRGWHNSIPIKHFPELYQALANADKSDIIILKDSSTRDVLLSQNPGGYIIYHLEEPVPSLNCGLDRINDEFIYPRLSQVLFTILAIRALNGNNRDKIQIMPYLMTGSDPKRSYSIFAQHYDAYMAHVDYRLWIKKIRKWFGQNCDLELKRVFELACGTGNVACQLVSEGVEVDASDASGAMLEIAETKSNAPMLFNRDLCEPIPGINYDLILCLFDSLNYLLKNEDISKMLMHAHVALKPGGLLIFDVSTLNNSRTYFSDLINFSRFKHGYLVHEAEFDEDNAEQRSNLTFFREAHGTYSIIEERHLQKVYRNSELLELIEASPLTLVAIHSPDATPNLISRKHTALDKKFPRLFYVLKKEV